MSKSLSVRFWEKVNCAGQTRPHMKTCCWEWVGAEHNQGYGKLYYGVDGIYIKAAHHVMRYLQFGRWPELDVLHLCDNPACVRPSHLMEGTHQENMRQMALRGPKENYARGEEQHLAKLTEELVTEIRSRHTAGESIRKLAKDYPVSRVSIRNVVHRKTWKHVP